MVPLPYGDPHSKVGRENCAVPTKTAAGSHGSREQPKMMAATRTRVHEQVWLVLRVQLLISYVPGLGAGSALWQAAMSATAPRSAWAQGCQLRAVQGLLCSAQRRAAAPAVPVSVQVCASARSPGGSDPTQPGRCGAGNGLTLICSWWEPHCSGAVYCIRGMLSSNQLSGRPSPDLIPTLAGLCAFLCSQGNWRSRT